MPSNAPETEVTSPLVRQREYNIHRCRFVDYQPPKITSLAFSHPPSPETETRESLLLAIGRSNGDIDIWSPLDDWVHKTTFRGGKQRSIEGLAWVQGPKFKRNAPRRLFSIGSSEYLTEWDILTGIPKQNLASNAGAIWSLDASPDGTSIALGCDDGSVILVDVEDGNFEYSRSLERQNSRVLSLSWHPNGEILVGGCADATIRAWDTKTGRIITQMKVNEAERPNRKQGKFMGVKRQRKMDTLIWAVKVTSDGMVVSGDSSGSLKIWESKFWSLVESFRIHRSDILCLAVDNNEKSIFSSGVDTKVHRYDRLGERKWTAVRGSSFHKHDVRAMTSFQSKDIRMVVSGGVDRTFSVLSFTETGEQLRILPPVPQERTVTMAQDARFLLSWLDNKIKIWQVDDVEPAKADEDQIRKRYLVEMELNDEENISAATITSTGDYLVVATLSHAKLFSLTVDSATSKLVVEELGVFPHGARLVTFNPDGDTIILVTPDSEVQIHPFLDEAAPTTQFPYLEKDSYINKLAISPDGETFATSSSTSLVRIQSFNPESRPQTLPQPSSAITSLKFLTPDLIAVTLADRNRLLLFEKEGDDWSLHPWSQNPENIPIKIGITVDKCLGTFILNNETSKVWMWGANWLAWVEPDGEKAAVTSGDVEAVKGGSGGMEVTREEYPHWITFRYREVLLVDVLGGTANSVELVVVERPRHEMLESIAEPRFYSHQFGT